MTTHWMDNTWLYPYIVYCRLPREGKNVILQEILDWISWRTEECFAKHKTRISVESSTLYYGSPFYYLN